jgi:hypothetical protein
VGFTSNTAHPPCLRRVVFTSDNHTRYPKHLMYRVSRQMQDGSRCASIIPVDWIRRSIHLLPRFGPVIPYDWNSFTVLDKCHIFYVNPFSDIDSYLETFPEDCRVRTPENVIRAPRNFLEVRLYGVPAEQRGCLYQFGYLNPLIQGIDSKIRTTVVRW